MPAALDGGAGLDTDYYENENGLYRIVNMWTAMENLKIFFDHLYFSVICVGIGAIVLYVILCGIGAERVISTHLLATGITCGALCCELALILTYRSVKSRASRPIIYTRRQY
ncbi:MAG: hypothetical protein ACLP5H_21020 [Desulfomonilaceae bacterium]